MEQLEICKVGDFMTLNIIIFFILGTILGSFYNVVGFRLPNDLSIVSPSFSYCPNCKKRLGFLELIPIISYFLLRGKCKECKVNISVFYPFVEFITGMLFAVSFYSFGFSPNLVIALTLVSLFSIVIVSDLNYLVIPDEVTLAASGIILVTSFMAFPVKDFFVLLSSGVLLFLLMYLIMLMGNLAFKKESLGGADIKLMFVAGLVLGPVLGVMVIFLASVIALPVALLIYLLAKEKVIPFGPFIVAAILLLFLLKIDVNLFINLFF